MVYKSRTQPDVDSETTMEAPQKHGYYIGLDVHKKTISYCMKDASGQVLRQGTIGGTLNNWMPGWRLYHSPGR